MSFFCKIFSHNMFSSKKRKRIVRKKHDVRRAMPHPNGVKPQGNYYMDMFDDNFKDSRIVGLGMLCNLEDTVIINLVEFLNARDLSQLAQVSKTFYVFTEQDDLWKHLCIQEFGGDFQFQRTWQQTYKKRIYPSYIAQKEDECIKVDFFYSELLYHSWRCLSANLLQWCKIDNVERRENLSLQDFINDYEIANKPVIITDVVTKWPAFAQRRWTKDNLIKDYGQTKFYINAGMEMNLKDFFQYCQNVQEENPAYLFDPKFGENCPSLLQDYQVPIYFQEDFFEVMHYKRPNYRWFLAGPVRSGATFHKDPNHTSAWNACVVGHKKWVMYPPNITPPGIYPSADGLEVTAPISIVEWFNNFYEGQNEDDEQDESSNKRFKSDGPIEFIQRPGDLVYVPTGWWHIVLNLEQCIAVTQNFCNRYNIDNVTRFIKKKDNTELMQEFSRGMKEKYPDVWDEVERKEEESKKEKDKDRVVFWERLQQDHVDIPFSFNFSDIDTA